MPSVVYLSSNPAHAGHPWPAQHERRQGSEAFRLPVASPALPNRPSPTDMAKANSLIIDSTGDFNLPYFSTAWHRGARYSAIHRGTGDNLAHVLGSSNPNKPNFLLIARHVLLGTDSHHEYVQLNGLNKWGRTPLINAAHKNNIAVAKLIFEAGSSESRELDLHVFDKTGKNFLQAASEANRPALIKLLERYCMNMNLVFPEVMASLGFPLPAAGGMPQVPAWANG